MTTPIILPKTPLSDAQQDCVDKLKEALEQAETGRVSTVGIIVCFDDGPATVIGGSNAAALNLGIDLLKDELFARVRGDRDVKTSRIVRARG